MDLRQHARLPQPIAKKSLHLSSQFARLAGLFDPSMRKQRAELFKL